MKILTTTTRVPYYFFMAFFAVISRYARGFTATTRRPRFYMTMSIAEATSESSYSTAHEEEPLLDPSQLFEGKIPYPKSLSPSAALEFKACPQSYLFQYLYGLKRPNNLALAKGSMCHEALEKVFDIDPPDRSLEVLQNLFRSCWAQKRQTSEYNHLFLKHNDWDLEAEKVWGREGLELLKNYVTLEDPRNVERPNPVQREIWLSKKLSVDPLKGVTGYVRASANGSTDKETDDGNEEASSFLVRGIVDRLDMIRISKSDVALRIVDYKTGKAPNFKYSTACNERIAEEAFYQLKIYALLLREKGAALPNGMDLRMLRLLYLTSESGEGQYLDMDLGATQEERDVLLQEMHADLSNVWTTIMSLVESNDPKAFVHCGRSFCYCHTCRPKFLPGTLYDAEQPHDYF